MWRAMKSKLKEVCFECLTMMGRLQSLFFPPTYTSQLFLQWVGKHFFNIYRQKIPPMEMFQNMKITNFDALLMANQGHKLGLEAKRVHFLDDTDLG